MRPQMLLLFAALATATSVVANGAAAQSHAEEASAAGALVLPPESLGSLKIEARSRLAELAKILGKEVAKRSSRAP